MRAHNAHPAAFLKTLAVVGALTTSACVECRYYNDCGEGAVCVEGRCEELPGETCEQTGESPYFRPTGALEGALHWTCNLPSVADEAAPFFSSYEGPLTLVSGGSGKYSLALVGATDLAGRKVFAGVRGNKTYHEIPNVTVVNGRVEMELFILPRIPSSTILLTVAIDDGRSAPGEPSFGPDIEIPINIIGVSSGDIQVSVTWDAFTDVDIYVEDPQGAVIYYGEKTSPSGGRLDLDSNAACQGPFKQNENVFWALDTAPSGTYRVWVNLWSQCDHVGVTRWRMTRVLRAGETDDLDVVEGALGEPATPGFFPDATVRPPDLTFDF